MYRDKITERNEAIEWAITVVGVIVFFIIALVTALKMSNAGDLTGYLLIALYLVHVFRGTGKK